MKERDHFEDVGLELSITVKEILRKWDGSACITFIWLRIGTGGGLL
jgi:hypothetical protein